MNGIDGQRYTMIVSTDSLEALLKEALTINLRSKINPSTLMRVSSLVVTDDTEVVVLCCDMRNLLVSYYHNNGQTLNVNEVIKLFGKLSDAHRYSISLSSIYNKPTSEEGEKLLSFLTYMYGVKRAAEGVNIITCPGFRFYLDSDLTDAELSVIRSFRWLELNEEY